MNDELVLVRACYRKIAENLQQAREHFKGPLTLTEKILAGHLIKISDEQGNGLVRRQSYALFYPDGVVMQDATAQMALLQFMTAGKKSVSTLATIHCDHLILAHQGSKPDLQKALTQNQEVYEFLKSASQKYGIDFWEPGSGIIHQVVLENYAFPGGMIIGTDSHTPNAGGLGMVAIGVGGADAVDVLTGAPFNIRWPGLIGVCLTGKLQGWASAKDVILKLMGILTVKGGTNAIVEFFGPGCQTISATGKCTITNMGAEHGATTSIFPYDETMGQYLVATGRPEWAQLAFDNAALLQADPEVYQNPERFYDRVIMIDLDKLEPHIVGPHTPDLARPICTMKEAVLQHKYPSSLAAALIGSCTNSSYEDIGRAAFIARFARERGLKTKVPFYITPGSESVRATLQRDGLLEDFSHIGGTVLANACGPCIGQWHRTDIHKGQSNSIISSYNRNFPGRNDGNQATLSFLASPEIVTAIALSGDLSFNPLSDTLRCEQEGSEVKLPIPYAATLPKTGLQMDHLGLVPALTDGSVIEVKIDPRSDRLAFLQSFPPWSGQDFLGMPILLKAKGKCTTDHISPAGVWLKYRGHLDKISDNTYLGAINAFCVEAGKGLDATLPHLPAQSLPKIARSFKEKKIDWVVVADENFGEGSSREHAAMQPRYLGCKVIICRSFARIHETNLKKHGILPLTFQDKHDYDKIGAFDRLDVVGLANLASKPFVKVVLRRSNGTSEALVCLHSLSPEQIEWFQAGSALNYVALQAGRYQN